jgi:hypothetical protein
MIMRKRILILIALLLALVVLVPASAAHAAPNFDRTVSEGETVHEDLVIFGGRLVIEDGATVDGDVSIFGGTAEIEGDVEGDVAIFGGEVRLAGSIGGDIVIFGGQLQADSSADVDGECILIGGSTSGDGDSSLNCSEVGDFAGLTFPAFVDSSPPIVPPVPEIRTRPDVNVHIDSGRGFFGTISAITGQSLLMGLIALAVAYLTPNNLNQVGQTLREKPGASGAVGVLSLIAVPTVGLLLLFLSILLTIICIGILGYPIVIAIFIAFVAALLLGWVAIGTLFGRRLARWLKLTNRSLPVVAGLGTVVLTLAVSLLTELPFFLGGPLWGFAAFIAGCVGLGAVALTRFGTRPYPMVSMPNDEKMDEVLETLPDEDSPSEKSPID